MILGFSGTRDGMTHEQSEQFIYVITGNLLKYIGVKDPNIEGFHHGDCIGSDAGAHGLVRAYLPGCPITVHPPIKEDMRAFCDGNIILPQKNYLERDRDIIRVSHALIATPKTDSFTKHSGTWYTIHYALKKNRPVILIKPSGETSVEFEI